MYENDFKSYLLVYYTGIERKLRKPFLEAKLLLTSESDLLWFPLLLSSLVYVQVVLLSFQCLFADCAC